MILPTHQTNNQIWSHKATKQIFADRDYHRLHIIDSINIFMENIERIGHETYVATNDDIVLSRVRTTTIAEMDFYLNRVQFKIIDVGGQRSERRKWMPLFQGVDAVIFVVAINEYDQVLREDSRRNRLVESVELFDAVCNSQWLCSTPVILFLNKRDLFADKIRRVDLVNTFPDYKGGRSFDRGCRYIMKKFISSCQPGRNLFIHITCATDRSNIEFVFEAVKESVLSQNVNAAGF
eukprot:c11857_g1_i1.p1 GENE.c11857_g1_i1~~c11857_g1_i1.p1  ORF type:complete len:236 (+),score=67.81 c11857_g1_i1:714-1421(+)